jgi:hypothetical protein
MRPHILRLPLLLALAASTGACARKTEPTPPNQGRADLSIQLDRTFRLGVGKEALLADGNVRVRFEQVSEDSRCPTGGNIQCVWQGNARIVLALSQDGSPPERDSVSLNLEPHSVRRFGLEIKLVGLEPAPTGSGQPAPGSYVATLVVTRVGG